MKYFNGNILGKHRSFANSGIWDLHSSNRNILNYPLLTSANVTSSTTTSMTLTSNTNVAIGDIVVVSLVGDNSITPSNPEGWTILYSNSAFDGTSMAVLAYKEATASGSQSVIFNSVDSTCKGIIGSWRYVSMDVDSVDYGLPNINNPKSIDAVNGDLSVLVAHIDGNNSLITFPTGYTSVTDASQSTPQMQVRMGYKNIINTGTETPGTITGVSNTWFMRCTSFRLKWKYNFINNPNE